MVLAAGAARSGKRREVLAVARTKKSFKIFREKCTRTPSTGCVVIMHNVQVLLLRVVLRACKKELSH